jgi:hypothetical protein
VGELNEGKRDKGRGHAHREGQGARAELGWAGPHRGSKLCGMHNYKSEFKSRSKIRNETKRHTRLNTTSDKRSMIRHEKKYDSV